MELDRIVKEIGLSCNKDKDSVLYNTGDTSFYLEEDSLSYTTLIPVTSRHRFNTLVDKLPDNVLAYNFRTWFRSEPLKKLMDIQNKNKDPHTDHEGITYLRKGIQEHIPELIELIKTYYSCFTTSNS